MIRVREKKNTNSTNLTNIRAIRVICVPEKKEKYEMCCNSGGVRHEIGRVDEELPETIAQNR